MKIPFPSFNPISRIALGLVALVLSTLMVVDMVFGLIPDRADLAREIRQQISEGLAVQSAALLQAGDISTLQQTLGEVLNRNKELRSLAVRQYDGGIVARAGEHDRYWQPPEDGSSTLTQVRVPVLSNGKPWGEVELSFRPLLPETLSGWLSHPPLVALVTIGLGSFLAFYLYMRRVLEYLDPSTAIPDRVRTAFDTLAEGVLILDKQGRVVLANRAFRNLHPRAQEEITGKPVVEMEWLVGGFHLAPNEFPWSRAMASRTNIGDETLEIARPDEEEPVRTIVGCSPILDGHNRLRGCLVNFSDVTVLHRINDQLLVTLTDLESSREEIRRQNEELHRLATRDPMTGCLNRRAFFGSADPLYAQLKEDGEEVCCIMSDIDHFKSFNDRYGHAVGDQVIKSVAKCLGSELREVDMLCRYGGEEFCIMLPGSTPEQALDVAERLRLAIEHHAGAAVRDIPGIRITSSFGVASIRLGAKDPAELIDQADNALYQSKQNGRNRVSLWAGERSVGAEH
ncbi:MAG: sensor domain-containing diguanylate cyclase [Zoogloea sp.]|uniref:sensor domain-containing diguanylate cyclase n=1 Tax=Zoogloea sp. TaxID=49181 RepID=UPI002626E137|nr:sensor domain-containing diguanylate cyclase [Zoogloea sp.]MDD2990751.1 sensor domain-containing diguanylate cyclase [Zoogloea sp.]